MIKVLASSLLRNYWSGKPARIPSMQSIGPPLQSWFRTAARNADRFCRISGCPRCGVAAPLLVVEHSLYRLLFHLLVLKLVARSVLLIVSDHAQMSLTLVMFLVGLELEIIPRRCDRAQDLALTLGVIGLPHVPGLGV